MNNRRMHMQHFIERIEAESKPVQISTDLIKRVTHVAIATSLGAVHSVYARSLQSCDPIIGTEKCNRNITVYSGYILLASGFIETLIQIFEEGVRETPHQRAKEIIYRISTIWRGGIIDLGAMHAFFLKAAEFIITEAAISKGHPADENVDISKQAFWLLASSMFLTAFLSNINNRRFMGEMFHRCPHASELKRIISLCFDFIFDAMRGFAGCRGFVATLESMAEYLGSSKILYTVNGMIIRYALATTWGLTCGYTAVKHSPDLSLEDIVVINVLPRHKPIIKRIVELLNHFFITFTFTFFTVMTIENEEYPHKEIHSILLACLLSSLVHLAMSKSCSRQQNITNTADLIHILNSSREIEEERKVERLVINADEEKDEEKIHYRPLFSSSSVSVPDSSERKLKSANCAVNDSPIAAHNIVPL